MTSFSSQAASDSHDPHDVGHHNDGHVQHSVHVVPPITLILTFVALLIGTVLTVAVTYVDLGALNLWVALAVAVLKASIVALFFMHLWWDNPFNGIILISALLFLIVFIGVALMDTKEYQPDFEMPRGVILDS